MLYTQLYSRQLTARHTGDLESRTQPIYNFNMTAEVSQVKLRLPTFSGKYTSILFLKAEVYSRTPVLHQKNFKSTA